MMNNSKKGKPNIVSTESRKGKTSTVIHQDQNAGGKRQGDSLQDPNQKRRAAFGDITNAFKDNTNLKVGLKKSKLPSQKPALVTTKPTLQKENKPKKKTKPASAKVKGEVLSDESLVVLSQGSLISSQGSESSSSQESLVSTDSSSSESFADSLIPLEETEPPKNVDNVDKENNGDPVQVPQYARDIFTYYKERELSFKVEPYMHQQKSLTTSMRAILVDWLVEVQENFELNHETLYLAVKLVDLYVSKKEIAKEILQLVGAVSLFIASKFDERCPPLVEDFLYICDDAYKRRDFLAMERSILKAIGFDIGFPLSYRFLRRYAKCARASMETLTLARYILEMTLMDYEIISLRESEVAAASLLVALRMKKAGDWTTTLEYYTGYKESDLISTAKQLSSYVSNPPKQLNTIKSKYSHKVFYEVAKIPCLSDEDWV